MFIVLALYKFFIIIIIIIIFYRGHPRFRNFYSTIPVDIVSVKSKMNSLFDPARVVIKLTINKIYFVPEWLVFVVVIMLWNGGGLVMSRMSRSCILILSCMGLSVSPTILFSLVSSTSYAALVSFVARLFHLLFFLKKTWRFYL